MKILFLLAFNFSVACFAQEQVEFTFRGLKNEYRRNEKICFDIKCNVDKGGTMSVLFFDDSSNVWKPAWWRVGLSTHIRAKISDQEFTKEYAPWCWTPINVVRKYIHIPYRGKLLHYFPIGKYKFVVHTETTEDNKYGIIESPEFLLK